MQVRLWEWRDTIQDIWEDPAIQVINHVSLKPISVICLKIVAMTINSMIG